MAPFHGMSAAGASRSDTVSSNNFGGPLGQQEAPLDSQVMNEVEALSNHLAAQMHCTKTLDVRIAIVAEDANVAAAQG